MKKKYHQGRFMPSRPEKYVGDINTIEYRSGWELKFMKWADENPGVLKWASEELVIPYISPVDQRGHRYFTDFVILVQNRAGEQKKYVIEIKPSKETMPPKGAKKTRRLLQETATYAVNQAKWHAADAWCKKHGMTFMVLTEKELGV